MKKIPSGTNHRSMDKEDIVTHVENIEKTTAESCRPGCLTYPSNYVVARLRRNNESNSSAAWKPKKKTKRIHRVWYLVKEKIREPKNDKNDLMGITPGTL